ncbi:MAG: hypothetical protein KF841_07450 [Phycisphaerae bacterium]|nr:hypothetical protein [Phycisphaerae bacterium]
MARTRAHRLFRMLTISVAVLPFSSYAAWQGFLGIFSPPSAAAHELSGFVGLPTESAAMPNDRIAIDDAGRSCTSCELEAVELRVQTDDVNFIGHAFLCVGATCVGFRTDVDDHGLSDYLWPLSAPTQGIAVDDSAHAYDYVLTYRVCPLTARLLESSIRRHSRMPYQVGDWRGGRNCATWARDRLIDVGLAPPPGDCPNRMAWSMRRSREHLDPSNSTGEFLVKSPEPRRARKGANR